MPVSDVERQRCAIPSPERLSDEERARYGIDLNDPEPPRPLRPNEYVVAGPMRRDGQPVLMDGRGQPLRPSPDEQKCLAWERRRQLRAALFAAAAAREMSLTAIVGLRHKAAVLWEQANEEEPTVGRLTLGGYVIRPTRWSWGPSVVDRAEQELAEIKRLQRELRAAGATKIGTWLRHGGGDEEPPSSANAAGSVH